MVAEQHRHENSLISGKTSLARWYRICAAGIAELPHELTMRQWAILIHVYLVKDMHTVKSLAYTFDIPKPAVCRALDTLSLMGLVKRVKDSEDKRNVFVEKTLKGIGFLNHFQDIVDRYEP